MRFRRYFRPRLIPSKGIPLGGRSVGHYIVSQKWRDNVEKKRFTQIFWCVRGTGTMMIEGVPYELGPQKIAIYTPGMLHQIEALNEEWEYYWWTVDGACASAILEELSLSAGIYEAGPVPIEKFEEMSTLITHYNKESELKASALAYDLLCQAATFIQSPYRLAPHQRLLTRIFELCDHHWADPNFNVNELADQVHIHRSRLSRIFKESTKMTPSNFIIQIRIDNACSLLRETRLSISQIALQCGFNDPDYFARVFKSKIKMTAKEYRHDMKS